MPPAADITRNEDSANAATEVTPLLAVAKTGAPTIYNGDNNGKAGTVEQNAATPTTKRSLQCQSFKSCSSATPRSPSRWHTSASSHFHASRQVGIKLDHISLSSTFSTPQGIRLSLRIRHLRTDRSAKELDIKWIRLLPTRSAANDETPEHVPRHIAPVVIKRGVAMSGEWEVEEVLDTGSQRITLSATARFIADDDDDENSANIAGSSNHPPDIIIYTIEAMIFPSTRLSTRARAKNNHKCAVPVKNELVRRRVVEICEGDERGRKQKRQPPRAASLVIAPDLLWAS
ncbi:uncharacterized protein MYCGRDRAFT_97696 [Zymoseptoria tritici IPO323]|uniref:Uncharacterized protein n=1 Tax=Zymoseptoria tritici (strain CBS 115943 / IPO323) TaxID=336722 RepID=F9XR09_ZYMTI|nr:uncharacterized protein MYCGRDRAFT_97696 [Zymoseptoria tritici IPO323]EGP82324.1 hypothetical protein MYCGRDRAFT_97696 [Zymoseptoria tritici IPO323]